jgi:hypothetical protein
LETISTEELIRESGRTYRTVKRHLALAGVESVGRDGRRVLYLAVPARAALPAKKAAPGNDEGAGEFHQHRALRERYAALIAKEEYETLTSNLIPREDVDAAMRFLGATVLSLMESFPDQQAPILCAVSDMNEVQALLTEACQQVLLDVGKAIERHKKTISQDAA